MLTIGRLGNLSGLETKTLRYYDRVGLVRPAGRTGAGYRMYDETTVDRLHFILRAKALGMSLADIRRILAVRDEGAAGGIFLRIPQGQSLPLKPGSLFAVGDRLLRFAGSVPAPPPPPPDGTMRLGAPRPEGPAVLVEEWLEGGVGGRVYLRTGPSITVGRAGCAVNLGEDGYLSQAHAEIVVEPDGSASLRDLGSSNGTFLRVAPGSEAPLKNGDELRMGREVLRVEVA